MPTAYEETYSYSEYLKIQHVGGHDPAMFLNTNFHEVYSTYLKEHVESMESPLLDLGCNSGGGLLALRKSGFTDLYGVDLNPDNVALCKSAGFENIQPADAHQLSVMFEPEFFSVIYSTHVLEHMYSPSKVVAACHTLLRKSGTLFIVLPYPDGDSPGHLGSVELGTCQVQGMRHSQPYDDGKSVSDFFSGLGFDLVEKRYDSRREPEIWLLLTKRT